MYEDLRSTKTLMNNFLLQIEAKMMNNCKALGWPKYIPCDEIPMALALIGNDVIKTSVSCYADVENAGRLTRGQVMVDWNGSLKEKENVVIVTELKSDVYMDLLRSASR